MEVKNIIINSLVGDKIIKTSTKFVIPGKPQGKARPRLSRHGTYTPNKTKEYEELVKYSYLQNDNRIRIDGSLSVTIYAYFELPKDTSKKKRAEMLNKPYTHKPDADNIAKIILDGLNGVAYKDDSQISSLKVHKYYSDKSFVEVEVTKEL